MPADVSSPHDLAAQLRALESLPVSALRERYKEAFGEPTRSANRRWLLRRVAWRLQALAEGDLSERARRRAHELARDADVRLRPPALRAPAPGAPRPAAIGRVAGPADRRLPAPGTVLVRQHRGEEHRVTVLPAGFEHQGRTYRSLSAVAAAITGTHWNGYLFFGLTTAKERS